MPRPAKPGTRFFSARFPDGTTMRRGLAGRVVTHAYLVLYKSPDSKIGFQRHFCCSLDEAEARIEAEKSWLSKHHHTLIETFIVEVEEENERPAARATAAATKAIRRKIAARSVKTL